MNASKLRLCKVGQEVYWFHGFTQISHIVSPSPLRGGHSGGVVSDAYAILEKRDGTVVLAEVLGVQFLEPPEELAKYEEEGKKDV